MTLLPSRKAVFAVIAAVRAWVARRRSAAPGRLPASPFLRAAPGPAAPLPGRRLRSARPWVVAAAATAALAALAVSQRWFDLHGWFRPLYAVHDNLVLPALGRLWTAAFPWALCYVLPGGVALVLALTGSLSGRRPLAALQRAVILAVAQRHRRGFSGIGLLTTAHRLQVGYGVPGHFMRLVIADAAAAAVDAAVFAARRDPARNTAGDGGPEDGPQHGSDPADLAAAWRLVAAAGAMAADAGDDAGARVAAAGTIAVLWLVAPPGDPATRLAVRTAWQRLWLPPAAAEDPDHGDRPADAGPATAGPRGGDAGGPERVARFLRQAMGGLEAAIRDLEHPGPAAVPHWQHYAELIITATFLAGLRPAGAALAMAVIDAVERTAIADLVSGRDGAGAIAEAVAQALAVTRGREAAGLIAARIETAAAPALRSWRQHPEPADVDDPDPDGVIDPDDLGPALAGLAAAAALPLGALR